MNVDKMAQENSETIGKLWTGYHIMQNKLSAAVPSQTYYQMIETAKKFPQFVLPLPRTTTNEDGAEEKGYEMYFLQWIMLSVPPGVSKNTPPPSAVLFTPLAEYKLRQEFAQPALVLSHYTDFIESKGLVLLRGDITESGGDTPKPAVSQKDAQLLALCLQRFYHLDFALEGWDTDEQAEQRRALLRAFYEQPDKFDINKLIDTALIV